MEDGICNHIGWKNSSKSIKRVGQNEVMYLGGTFTPKINYTHYVLRATIFTSRQIFEKIKQQD